MCQVAPPAGTPAQVSDRNKIRVHRFVVEVELVSHSAKREWFVFEAEVDQRTSITPMQNAFHCVIWI